MTKSRLVGALVAAVAALSVGAASAGEFRLGGIAVESPWARATPGAARTGAAFMTIRNRGAAPDRLVAVRTAVAKRAGLHRTVTEGGIMKMRRAASIEVPAGGAVALAPGGYHVMLMGLAAPLRQGASFPLTLAFDRAGEVEVTVEVMKAGAMGPMKTKHAD